MRMSGKECQMDPQRQVVMSGELMGAEEQTWKGGRLEVCESGLHTATCVNASRIHYKKRQ